MASYTWEFGAADSGVHFTIKYDIATQTFTVVSLEGKFDLNALWWDNGVDDNVDMKVAKGDSALNMNGSESNDWDGYAKLSSAGLGPAGEDKSSFISDGETATFSLADFGLNGAFDPANGGTLGVRATSVNGGDSLKMVDTDPLFTPDPVNPPAPDYFPDFYEDKGFDISHVTFYFETGTDPLYEGDINGDVGEKGKNDPDGWFTFKFDVDEAKDVLGDEPSNDLDDWYQLALDYIATQHPDLDLTTIQGVAIKGGSDNNGGGEFWYSLDGPGDDDDDEAPSVFPEENKGLDDSGTVSFDGTDYAFA
jgi:hypothetical protein